MDIACVETNVSPGLKLNSIRRLQKHVKLNHTSIASNVGMRSVWNASTKMMQEISFANRYPKQFIKKYTRKEGWLINKAILMGRLTRDPEVRYSAGENSLAIARYTVAVDRRSKRAGEASADFISCVAFGRAAEFAEKYFHQGIKIAIVGRIQTGSYTNRDGQKVYTTEVVVEDQEFAESKAAAGQSEPKPADGSDGFMTIPDGIQEELPFS